MAKIKAERTPNKNGKMRTAKQHAADRELALRGAGKKGKGKGKKAYVPHQGKKGIQKCVTKYHSLNPFSFSKDGRKTMKDSITLPDGNGRQVKFRRVKTLAERAARRKRNPGIQWPTSNRAIKSEAMVYLPQVKGEINMNKRGRANSGTSSYAIQRTGLDF